MARAALLLLLAALTLPAAAPYRVAFLGTSVTCGAGATERFLPLVVNGLEKRLARKVESWDLCFGGAHSLTTLLLLKHAALGWRPDLAVVETGALDGFAPALAAPALEQIAHTLAEAGIPAVLVARQSHCSEEATRPLLLRLGREYGLAVADVPAHPMPDNCHPGNAGHARIAESILAALPAPAPPRPRRPPPLPGARFQAAARALRTGTGHAAATPQYFPRLGGGLLATAPAVEWRFDFHGPLAAVLFRLGHTPAAMAFQIDGGPWHTVAIQPPWFLNYYLAEGLAPGPHQLTLRLTCGPAPVLLDGLEQFE